MCSETVEIVSATELLASMERNSRIVAADGRMLSSLGRGANSRSVVVEDVEVRRGPTEKRRAAAGPASSAAKNPVAKPRHHHHCCDLKETLL